MGIKYGCLKSISRCALLLTVLVLNGEYAHAANFKANTKHHNSVPGSQVPEPGIVALLSASGMMGILLRRCSVRR